MGSIAESDRSSIARTRNRTVAILFNQKNRLSYNVWSRDLQGHRSNVLRTKFTKSKEEWSELNDYGKRIFYQLVGTGEGAKEEAGDLFNLVILIIIHYYMY